MADGMNRLHELDLLIERATNDRRRDDLISVRDVCGDTPESQSTIRLPEETPEKCRLCDSLEHVECGFCARCHEHAVTVRDPDDPDSEALTECCGSRVISYDHDPT